MVVVINDDGEKYLDTVFDDEWMSDRDLIDKVREAEVAGLLERYRPRHRPDPREIEVLRHLHYALPDTFAIENGLAGATLEDYADRQVPQAKLTHLLHLVDMPVHEIAELLAAGNDDHVYLALEKHRQRLTDQATQVAQVLASMRSAENTHTILMPDPAMDLDGAAAK